MQETKSKALTVRVHPAVKEGLRAVAEQDRRSLANMIEVMIRDYCGRSGIAIQEQGLLFDEASRQPMVASLSKHAVRRDGNE